MIRIICVGNLKEKYLSEACNEYLKRISKYEKIEIVELKENNNPNIQTALEEERKDIEKHIKGYSILLAIKGEQLTSVQLSNKIEEIMLNGNSSISFIIGSSCGTSPNLICDYKLSFSKMTFPHQLTRVILLEQIYRAFSILHNTPYHK